MLKTSLLLGMIFLITSQCSTLRKIDPSLASQLNGYGLIYYSERGSANQFANQGFGGLYLANFSTWEEQGITGSSDALLGAGFSWSPITQKLIFSGRGENDPESTILYVSDLKGNKARLSRDDTYDNRGYWSPNGHTIAFKSFRSDNSFFYLMDANGSNIRPVFETEPQFLVGNEFMWAPNSQRIALSIIRDDNLPINLDAPLSNYWL